MLGRPWRWLVVYLAILGATGWLFTKLPGSFLPDEDQGYFISVIQLPSGATRERTLEVLQEAEAYFLKQKEVQHVIGVAGFSFFGRGQNAAITFVRLKDWDERPGKDAEAPAVVRRANMAFFRIKQAMMFAVNVPPIPELAAIGGFDFRLQDRGGLGRDKLLEARNMALGLPAQNPVLVGVRPEGQEAGPQIFLDVDRLKARAWAWTSPTSTSAAVGAGRGLHQRLRAPGPRAARADAGRARHPAHARGHPAPAGEERARRHDSAGRAGARLLGHRRAQARPLQRPAFDEDSGGAAPGRSTGEAMKAMEDVAAKLPPGVGFEWSGTSYEERQSGSQAPFLFAVSLVVVFLCLAALYESWSIPFAVMLVVPLGIFGSVLAVELRGLTNDVYFKVGLIAIIGLVGEERDPDHRVRPRAAGAGHGPDRGHAGSLPPAHPAHRHDLDRLHLRRHAAGHIHRRRRQQPPRHRHRRDGRHDHGDGARGVLRPGLLPRRAPLLPRPWSPAS
jgi:multidrug efflux pump